MTKQTNWRKRLVRAGVVAVMSPLLISSGYAGTLLASRWAVNHGFLTYKVPNHSVFQPLRQYETSDLPGSVEFDTLSRWLNADGQVAWQSIAVQVKRIHRGEILSPCQRET